MILRNFDDYDLPFYRCEDAYKYLEEGTSGKPKLKCDGFRYGENNVCTICKKCKYLNKRK